MTFKPLADGGAHTVSAHSDAVQCVGDRHRALLVCDDDQLGVLAQVIQRVHVPQLTASSASLRVSFTTVSASSARTAATIRRAAAGSCACGNIDGTGSIGGISSVRAGITGVVPPIQRVQKHRLAERMVLRAFECGEHLLCAGNDDGARIVRRGRVRRLLPTRPRCG